MPSEVKTIYLTYILIHMDYLLSNSLFVRVTSPANIQDLMTFYAIYTEYVNIELSQIRYDLCAGLM